MSRCIAIVVMGPAGVGKTTTAEQLATALGWPFAEGDSFHPQTNIDRMSRGIPLEDADRAPWLVRLRDWISTQAAAARSVVVTCSALKRRYRDILRDADADVRFVQLVADEKLAAARLSGRSGHFMPVSLLASQYAALEPLQADEPGVQIAASQSSSDVVRQILTTLGLDRGAT